MTRLAAASPARLGMGLAGDEDDAARRGVIDKGEEGNLGRWEYRVLGFRGWELADDGLRVSGEGVAGNREMGGLEGGSGRRRTSGGQRIEEGGAVR
jgi:hypothetical protein